MMEDLGEYKILERLGSSVLGDVYRARDTRVGRTVAITVVSDDLVPTHERREHFLRDARTAAAVSHPNILTLYEAGEEGGRVYLINEFIQGEALENVIGGRPLNPRRALDLATQLAEALADAHAGDLIHGAITAETIVISPKGHAKIVGFGLARWMAAGMGGAEAGETGGAGAAGTEGVDLRYRADLSAVGRILFEMLTGRSPAPGAGVPSAFNRSLPREIDSIVGRALGKSGGFETAVTLAAELRALSAILDVRNEASAAAAPAIRRARPKRSLGRSIVLAVALGVVAAIIVIGLAMAFGYRFRSV